jgi:hypothetical protein
VTHSFAVFNKGTGSVRLTAPSLSNANDFSLSSTTAFPTTLSAGASLTFDVALSPLNAFGAVGTTVKIPHDATGVGQASPFAFDVSGTACAAIVTATATGLTPTHSLVIPAATASSPQTLTADIVVTSAGDILGATLSLSLTYGNTFPDDMEQLDISLQPPVGPAIELAANGSMAGDDMSGTVFDDNGPQSIDSGVGPYLGTFQAETPFSSLSGSAQGTWKLIITNSDTITGTLDALDLTVGVGPLTQLEVHSGSATGPAVTSGTTASGPFAFGSQNVSTTSSVTVVVLNSGTTTVSVSTPTLTGSSEFALGTAGFPSSLAAGASASFTVKFDPTVQGSVTGTVSMVNGAPNLPHPFVIGLSGTGVEAGLQVLEDSSLVAISSGATVAFGSQTVNAGAGVAHLITLKNPGNTTLNLTAPALSGTNAGEFALVTTSFHATVAAGSSTSFEVRFAPTSAGSKAATATFTDDAGGTPSTFTLALTGTGSVSLSSKSGGGGGGGGCTIGTRPDFATPIFGAAMIALHLLLRRRRRLARG